MNTAFIDYPLTLVQPKFDSSLVDLIIELESMRKVTLASATPASLFLELKELFHFLESVGSARIEGNNTTIAEYLETKIEVLSPETKGKDTESLQEILNIELAMRFVEGWIREGRPINETFIKSIQKMAVEELAKEGDTHAGDYRHHNVRIANSQHCPPDASLVSSYMDELFQFLRQDDPPRYDLLKVALAHHRFVWIHPFGNGNGRTVRLFTYALLLHYGYGLDQRGGIVNPTAIFCSDRDKYYSFLAQADSGDPENLLAWAEYVLGGLKVEIEKINRLCNYEYVAHRILIPAIDYALDRENIGKDEYNILRRAIELKEIQNSDLKPVLPKKSTSSISILIKKLVKKKMLRSLPENSRKYMISFHGSLLLRGIIRALDFEDFLPLKDEIPA